jgi:hypothetical protein
MTVGEGVRSEAMCSEEDVTELEEQCGEFEWKYDEMLSRAVRFVTDDVVDDKKGLL